MKWLTIALLLLPSGLLQAAIVIIDDFSFAQSLTSASSNGSKYEASDPSIYGGYRSGLATGYINFRFIDGFFVGGDSSGVSSLAISGGTMSLSKTALTGSAFVTYEGRAFTSGDRIGDLSMDISGSASSLASPVLLLGHTAGSSDQIVTLFLTSAVDTYSSFKILLKSGSTETIVDLRNADPYGNGASGGVDFGNVEDILLGLANGDPIGTVELNNFAFVPEPGCSALFAMGMAYAILCRKRKGG
ncbi:hypothetical protein [Luteolibacter sp.]|uniref:hypothetical protein n=1 Tax=Luteolibacter sp. TaxID=1962973 RepID=UPI003263E9D8